MRLNRNALWTLGLVIGAGGLLTAPAFGEPPESPAEIAETVQLNRDIAAQNAAADARYQAAKAKYDQEKMQNDAARARYEEEVKHNAALQQDYQQKLKDYQNTYANKDKSP